ncbi:hypothetical protein [Chlamydia vaughanii]|uniref:hypothetical protein n=1 Tax=Chlamydia vaughanii TaxID=3112552 RepID=UPI0032B217AA
MTIFPVSLSVEESTLPVSVTPQHPSTTSNKCLRLATAIAVIAGLTVLALEIGFLVFFALPGSLLLVLLVSLAMLTSVILFAMTMYQLITRILKPKDIEDDKMVEERGKLLLEIENLTKQLTDEQVKLTESKSEVLALKGALEGKQNILTMLKEQEILVKRQVEYEKIINEELGLRKKLEEADIRQRREEKKVCIMVECIYEMIEKFRSLEGSQKQVLKFENALLLMLRDLN